MVIRTQPCMTVLYTTRQATPNDLPNLKPAEEAGARDLYRLVADLDLLVCGPQYWFYAAAEGIPRAGGPPQIRGERSFILEIALPVQGKIPTAVLPFFKRIPAFRCLSTLYEGRREGIAEEYRRMLHYIEDNKLKMNGVYSEIFLHIDPDDPAGQITEIRIGIT